MEVKAGGALSLPKGYKKTEIGIIPVEWEVKQISEIGEVKGRVGWKGYTKKDLRLFGPYAIGAKHIDKYNKLDLSEPTHLSMEKFLQSPEIIVKKDDVLIVQRGTIGKIVLIEDEIGDATINPSMLILRVKYFKSKFVYYYFLSEKGQSQIIMDTSSTGVPMITQKQVKNFQIPLPPLPEQKAIATVLSDTDNLIQALEKKIAKKQLIRKGTMQKLLSPKEGWITKTLGEVARYRRGSFPQPYGWSQWYDDNKGMPFVQVFDVGKNMKLKPTTKQKISDLAKDKSVFVRKGSVILTIQGSIGRIAVTQYDAYVDRTLLIFTDYKLPMNVVLFSYLVQEKFRIEKENAPGGIIKTITKEALSKFLISFPKSKEDQTQISQILSDMDREIETLEKKLAKYKQLKQGLMQVLLTGKIRLV